MPRIADYSIVSDNIIRLEPGQSSNVFKFNLNNDANTDTGGVLMLRIHAHERPRNLGFAVVINGKEVYHHPHGINEETCQTVNEVLEKGILKAGGVKVPNPNEVHFMATGEHGQMIISDVVVFFQRDI